jgi:hypothetical protein
VPENYISYLHRDQLVTGDGAKFTPAEGKQRTMRTSDIDQLLQRANREQDGSYRVVASKALEGKPIGRIRFMDTRPDDPNDLVAHENRRELRGYGTFAAWLNHVDVKSTNSLDMLVATEGASFVRHNLIDFGSALGSGAVGPADYWAGSQYLIAPGSIGRQMVGFGFVYPDWHTIPFYESRSIGRLPLNNASFDPEAWKPRVANHAFLQARIDDKFWAAQKLMALTTDLIRAAVKTGEFGDSESEESEEFLVRALAERRDAIGRAYLPALNPISDPMLTPDGILSFRNAAVDADCARAPYRYVATWSAFDNTTGESSRIGQTSGPTTEIEEPAGLPTADGVFIKVQLSAAGTDYAVWETPVDVYFQRVNGGWALVGFERMPEVRSPATTN